MLTPEKCANLKFTNENCTNIDGTAVKCWPENS